MWWICFLVYAIQKFSILNLWFCPFSPKHNYLYLKCLKRRYVQKMYLGLIYFFENESGRLRKLGDNTQTINNDVINHNFCQFRKNWDIEIDQTFCESPQSFFLLDILCKFLIYLLINISEIYSVKILSFYYQHKILRAYSYYINLESWEIYFIY